MSFKENTYQQMSLTDSFSALTTREQKALEKSWEKVFANEIFPAIEENRFSVLYSDKASRPNTPVNAIVGALIIKELFDYSDDEMVENLMLDSMMIESNIRKLSRMELIYTCVAKLARCIDRTDDTVLPDGLKHYADPNDFNRVIYHQRSTDADTRMNQILADADQLLAVCESEHHNSTEYDLFVRCLSEQIIVDNETRRLRTKEDSGMKSAMLQNPSDPEATFRSKAGKEHQRYVANLEESAGRNGSVVTEYQYGQNIHSDSRFIREHLDRMDEQEEKTVIVADGAYSGTENIQLASGKNVELITTSLTGKEVPDILADFEFNEEGTAKIVTPKAAHERAKIQRNMNSEEFKNYTRFRNGVETVPSNIRKNYHLEKLPRGR